MLFLEPFKDHELDDLVGKGLNLTPSANGLYVAPFVEEGVEVNPNIRLAGLLSPDQIKILIAKEAERGAMEGQSESYAASYAQRVERFQGALDSISRQDQARNAYFDDLKTIEATEADIKLVVDVISLANHDAANSRVIEALGGKTSNGWTRLSAEIGPRVPKLEVFAQEVLDAGFRAIGNSTEGRIGTRQDETIPEIAATLRRRGIKISQLTAG